jgi:TPP-dependent pyruvate/acetoin dehydrogenase alpha subunit
MADTELDHAAQPRPPGEGPATDELREWLATMITIRRFETECVRLSFAGKIPGGIHSSEGQEAVAVGSVRALEPCDVVSGTHRSHHHAIAKGMSLPTVMAELYGRSDGSSGGRGGTMHLVDRALNFLGSNGIVGAGLGLAMGASLAMQLRKEDGVAVGYVGDGGLNNGRVWEAINLAALWKLPLIAVCENNLYAVETHISHAMAGDSPTTRAAGFGLPAVEVDGQDVVAVFNATRAARRRAVAGDGPTFIEAKTYRYEGHNVGDVQNYRQKAEVEQWRSANDPIVRFRGQLTERGVIDDAAYGQLAADAVRAVEDAVAFAEASPWPDPRDAFTALAPQRSASAR